MNIDWDQELEQFFTKKYLSSWRKIHEAKYEFVTLEGEKIIFACSQQGYRCKCHDKAFELPNSMLRQHSAKYVDSFNSQLFSKLSSLAEQQNNQQNN